MRVFETYADLVAAMEGPNGFRFLAEFAPAGFRCSDCKQAVAFPIGDGIGTGYARTDADEFVCYACCGKRDQARMIETGRATLYLSGDSVSNWPGTLKLRVHHQRKGRHNFAGRRYDVWFTGPDGANWHGVQYGDNTQICHCRRTAA